MQGDVMSTTNPVAPAVSPLTPVQRRQLRELLQADWRDGVDEVVALSVQLHSHPEDDPMRGVLADRLDVVRRRLVDAETALARLASGSYGSCDSCDRRLPFELLERRPEQRWCVRCGPPTRGIGEGS
jgi:RNA polymerase-binding transcription factor DksA